MVSLETDENINLPVTSRLKYYETLQHSGKSANSMVCIL